MKKAVIYARYSSDRQREESIEGQIRVCEQYAERNDLQIIHIYADRALTGRTDKRPEFQMMIRDSAFGAFQYVLVYKLNRFSRDRYDSASYKHKLKKNGVKLLSAMENISDDPAGILLESVIEGIAEYYSAELSENVLRGMTQTALEGKWPGGNIPLGYKLGEDRRLVIDDCTVNTVRLIYRLFLTGLSVQQIVNELTDRKLTTSKHHNFTRSRVYYVLHNQCYLGILKWKDVCIPNAIPQIISQEMFDSVQKKVKYLKKSCIRTNGKYLLSGKIFCAVCGSKVTGTSGKSRSGKPYFYYGCSHHHRSKHYPYCETKNIRADILESVVCKETTKMLSNQKAIKAIAKQAMRLQKETSTKDLEVQSLKNRIADVSKKVKNCVKAIENGVMSEAITTALAENEATLEALKLELAKATINSDTGLTEEKICFFFQSVMKKAKETEKYKRILLTSLVRKVLISNDYIEIQYNYTEQLPDLVNPLTLEKCSCEYTNGGLPLHSYEHKDGRICFCAGYFYVRVPRPDK